MNLQENNFSFGGLHCMRDYGLVYAETSGHTITPPVTPNTYEIAGVSGSIIMPGTIYGTHRFGGNLFFLHDPPNQTAAQEALRKIAAWLLSGRQRLVFDYEPNRYYLAEVTDATKWAYNAWIEGGLSVAFDAQPYAYNVQANAAVMATAQATASISLDVETGEPAPLQVTIKNTGTAPIAAATVSVGIRKAAFSGLALAAGATLTINMEPPIGAAFSDGTSALPKATQFDYITLAAGRNTIAVALTYGTGTKGATITASARGRYL